MPPRAWGVFAGLWVATLSAFWRDAAWELVLAAAVFFLAAVSLTKGERWRPASFGFGLLAIAALALGQIALGATPLPSATLLAGVRALALAAWFFTLQRELVRARVRFLEFAVHGAGALALLSLAMMAAHRRGPWGNPNHLAVWCELLLAPAVWLAATKPRFWWAAAALLTAGASSGSRAGLGLLVLELLLLLAWTGMRRHRGKLALAAIAFPALAVLLGGDTLARKLRDPEPLLYRDQMWRSAITLWREAPWLGHGLGTFAVVYPQAATFDTGELVDHAHNDWLECGVEGGVVLVVLVFAGYLYTCRLALATPWLLGVLVAGLHALFDYPMARFPMWLWIISLVTLATLERPCFKLKRRSVKQQTVPAPPPIRGVRSPHPRIGSKAGMS
ncbi:MAG: O-antigen ligase family protein [Bryobacteraceae bacterium]|nr:O-antigen ligase family protein [Bryobacteraceae bacterium]